MDCCVFVGALRFLVRFGTANDDVDNSAIFEVDFEVIVEDETARRATTRGKKASTEPVTLRLDRLNFIFQGSNAPFERW